LKKITLTLSILLFSTFTFAGDDATKYSVGLGLGSAYSGLGANFAIISKTDMKYISSGCVAYGSISGYTCGFGAGWIITDLFNVSSNKHGLGVYISIVGNETDNSYSTFTNGTTKAFRHDNNAYGAGVSYTYFINGIDKSGLNVGVSIHASTDDDKRVGGFLQLGYQF